MSSDVELVHGDLLDADSLVAATRGADLILHAAGLLHVRRTRDWYEVNAHGTQLLTEAAVRADCKRLVFLSSNAAAGPAVSADRPLTEADEPHPLSHYGRSKLVAERAVLAASPALETVVLRPCMFYGPPVPHRHVDVYRRIQRGAMLLVGSGHFARSVTYIDNLVQACQLALTHPAAPGQTYFISDRPVYTTRSITEAMARALGVPARFVPVPRLAAPVAHRMDLALASLGLYWQELHLLGEADWNVGVSSAKAERELGYSPTVELEEGMRRAVLWCKEKGLL